MIFTQTKVNHMKFMAILCIKKKEENSNTHENHARLRGISYDFCMNVMQKYFWHEVWAKSSLHVLTFMRAIFFFVHVHVVPGACTRVP